VRSLVCRQRRDDPLHGRDELRPPDSVCDVGNRGRKRRVGIRCEWQDRQVRRAMRAPEQTAAVVKVAALMRMWPLASQRSRRIAPAAMNTGTLPIA